MNVPGHLIYPLQHFAEAFQARYEEGLTRLRNSSVAFVGLARNCAPHLTANLARLEMFVEQCGSWRLHIETNDNEDDTDQALADFCAHHRQATFTSQRLRRKQYSTEFAGPRTIALAEYRHACQQWVKECAADADYVVVIDWDQWGGWSYAGLINGIGWLVDTQGAYGMASVSLMEWQSAVKIGDDPPTVQAQWMHYDAWALRGVGQPDCDFDDYTHGMGGWKHHWIPPVGSEPVAVASAFGGLAIYRTEAYLKGSYDGTADCEHVPFHMSVRRATGQRLYLCPSMRCVMHWLPEESAYGSRQYGDD